MPLFKNAVLRAIEEYNTYRSPEAKAKLVKISESELILDFEGTFCRTCGLYDYLEDFIYELQKFANVNIKIVGFKEYKPEIIRVKYALKT